MHLPRPYDFYYLHGLPMIWILAGFSMMPVPLPVCSNILTSLFQIFDECTMYGTQLSSTFSVIS